MITLKKQWEIEVMAEAGSKLSEILEALAQKTRAGIETKELEAVSLRLIRDKGAQPAFLGYRPAPNSKAYPYSLCVSVNEVVVHGQPSDYVVKNGDIVKLDLGLRYRGYYVDSAITIGIGEINTPAQKLIQITRESLEKGIECAQEGNTTGDIGYAIQKHVEKNNFGIVESLTGHGIGKNLHEDPPVFNFGKRGFGVKLEEGMVLAIEPMVAANSGKVTQSKDSGFATKDKSLSAHFEHTVAITAEGPRILTIQKSA